MKIIKFIKYLNKFNLKLLNLTVIALIMNKFRKKLIYYLNFLKIILEKI